MYKKILTAAVLASSAFLSVNVSADPIISPTVRMPSETFDSSALTNPEIMAATSGCASASYCTLTELLAGGSISSGGLSFGNFVNEFDYGYTQMNTDNIFVSVIDFGGVLMLDYDFAPFGFGDLTQLPTLLDGATSGLLDLSFNIVSDGSVDIWAAWLYEISAAATSDADYEIQFDMGLMSGSDVIDDLFVWNSYVDNSVVDSDAYDIAIFDPVASLSVFNGISQISYEGLNLIYYADQLFYTQDRPVPAPFAIGLIGMGLIWFGSRRKSA